MMNLAAIRPMPTAVMAIPDGDAGTAATIQQMWRLIEQGKKSSIVRQAAIGIVQAANVSANDYTGEARAIFRWVLKHIRFTRDIRARETLHSADEILKLGAGDCDDCTVLILALCESIGAEGRITTISTLPPDANGPAEFTHVYPSVYAGGRWIALDCARENPAFGREPRYYTRLEDWPDPYEDASGVEYLNFYVGRGLTVGAPASRGMQGLRGLRKWQAPAKMTSRPRSQTYNAKPPANAPKLSRLGRMDRVGQDWSTLLPSLISTGAGATTEIIAASKGAPTSVTAQGVSTGAAPSPYSYPFAQGYVAGSSGSGLFSSPMMLILLLGGAAVLMISRRG